MPSLGLPALAQTTAPLSELDPGEFGDLRESFSELEAIRVPEFSLSSPAYTIVNPAGYGAGFGTAYFAAGGVFERRDRDDGQAGLGAGFGLGDPSRYFGLDLSVVLADVEEGLGGFNLKFHRNLIINDQLGWAAAVGWEDFATFGDISRDSSVYGSTTLVLKLSPELSSTFSRLALTVGVGGGRFRTEDDILEGESSVGVFGSGALRVTRAVSVIGEWTGQDFAAGLSFAPFSEVNLYVTPALRDIAGAGDNVKFSLSAGLSFSF